jgi:hypothetical protein
VNAWTNTIEMLVVVKAYPAISTKYGEVECVAGIRTDMPTPEWVRLFPVPFRDLPYTQRFQKYQLVRFQAEPHGSDTRPESLRPNVETFECGEVLETRKDKTWSRRRAYAEPLELDSMCEIVRRRQTHGTSLGVFRPAEVLDLEIERDTDTWDQSKEPIANQMSLLVPGKRGLEKIPYKFRYRYRCSDPNCPTHSQSIIDWELSQSVRAWRWRYRREEVLLAKIRERWLDQMWRGKRDSRLFVGNFHQYPDSFMVLGVFWPPIVDES